MSTMSDEVERRVVRSSEGESLRGGGGEEPPPCPITPALAGGRGAGKRLEDRLQFCRKRTAVTREQFTVLEEAPAPAVTGEPGDRIQDRGIGLPCLYFHLGQAVVAPLPGPLGRRG